MKSYYPTSPLLSQGKSSVVVINGTGRDRISEQSNRSTSHGGLFNLNSIFVSLSLSLKTCKGHLLSMGRGRVGIFFPFTLVGATMADPNDGKMFLQVIEKSGTNDVGPATCRYMHNRLKKKKKKKIRTLSLPGGTGVVSCLSEIC